MQTTLLGIAIAAILALVTALVGPLLIDWNRFRPAIEAEASRLIGAPVRITGRIEAAILPTPSLTLRDIEVAPADASGRIRARSLGVELRLGPLVRGQLRAAELHLAGPEFNLGLDASGQLRVPKLAIAFDADRLSIDRLNVEDGHAILSDARSGSRLVLDKIWFNGDVRSLAGPFKGDGAFVIAGELYAYRIATGRAGEDGGIKVRLNIDPLDRPLAIDADGTLAFDGGVPAFEGALSMARPAGIARPDGQTFASDPWRFNSRVKATSAAALFEQMELQYGPDERAIKLTGTADLKFGSKPRFDGVLSARQIDLDRALASPAATRQLPFAAIKTLSQSFAGTLPPSVPGRLGISVDVLTLAGASVHTVRGDVTTDGQNWNLDGFELRVPGFTQVNLSGRLDLSGGRLGFTGPVSVDSSDPTALIAWLEGTENAAPSRMKPLRARGEVTLGNEKIAIERLKADIDRRTVEGQIAYVWPSGDRRARLDADLNAAELDLDALLAFANAARAGTKFEMPGEVALRVAVDRAHVAGITARQVTARLRRDAKGLQVERFAVADFGGTAFDANGEIDTNGPSPRGMINLHIDARNLAGVVAVAERFAPDSADAIRRLAERWTQSRLKASLSLEDAGSMTRAKLAMEGRSGDIRLTLVGEATRNAAELALGNLKALAAADVQLQGEFAADDGTAIIRLLQLDKIVAVDSGRPGQLRFATRGPLGGTLDVDSRLVAGGVDASAKGTLRLGGDEPRANLRLVVASADGRLLRRGATARPNEPLPLTLTSDIVITRRSVRLDDFSGTAAGLGVRGQLGFVFDQPLRINGKIETDAADASAVIAAAIGMRGSATAQADNWTWSSEPFGQGFFDNVEGQVEFKAARMSFAPALALRQARGIAKFSRWEVAFAEVEGNLADGQATGHLTFSKSDEGLSAIGRIRLTNADAAALLASDDKPAVTGRLALALDVEGSGLSPAALIGSLVGNGTVSLARAQLAGLNAAAFEAAARAMENAVMPEAEKVAELVGRALNSAPLAVPSAEGVITISAGQLRLANTIVQAEGADLTMSGSLDLGERELNARLMLSARVQPTTADMERPVIFVSLKGPVSSPKRSVDASALSTWLTLRAVEEQSKRLEEIEAKRRLPMAARPAEIPPTATAPTEEAAPPLPPAIEIRPVPGFPEHKPARVPGPVQSGPTAAPKPPAKPPVPASSRLAPLDLSASSNN